MRLLHRCLSRTRLLATFFVVLAVLLSIAPAHAIPALRQTNQASLLDLGEFYWADGRQVPLLRRADRIAVRMEAADPAGGRPLSAAGPPPGYSTLVAVRPDLMIVEPAAGAPAVSAPELQQEIQQAAAAADVAWAAPVFQSPGSERWMVAADEVIVALRAGVTAAAFFADDARFTSYRPLPGTPDQFLATVAAGGGAAAVDAANSLQSDRRLRWASPNFYQDVQPAYTPNDSLLNQQWYLKNTGQQGGTPGADARVTDAWDIVNDASNIVIAVIDTGVQLDHPDLAANIFVNAGEIAGDGLDNDGNGWVDDVNGWDFAQNDNNPNPSDSVSNHGTAVAGVAAAVGNNGVGVSGVAYTARLLVAPIFSNGVYGGDAAAASAIYYAAGRAANGLGRWRGADILSNSWGGGAPNTAVTEAISWASIHGRNDYGAPVFFASGNDYKTTVSYPASLSGGLGGVIAVGASTDGDVRADYSNYGSALSIVAPSSGGVSRIVTTDRTGSAGYDSSDYTLGINGFGGTSSATPLAAGIGALLLAQNPDLTAGQVRALLEHSANKIGPLAYDSDGFNPQYGFGRVNALAALQQINTSFRELRVLVNDTAIFSNSTLNFGMSDAGAAVDLTVQVSNLGTADLSLGSVTLSGSAFSLVAGLSTSVLKAGESTSFVVRFVAPAPGSTSGALSFTSNDPDEGQFVLLLTGAGHVPSISGQIYEDWDADGVRDSNEPALCDTPYLDLNGNGAWDSLSEPYASCSDDGSYSFKDLAPGAYTVRLSNEGAYFTSIVPAVHGYTVSLSSSMDMAPARDFALVRMDTIYGRAYNDLSGDGTRQVYEPGAAGQQSYLDLNASGGFEQQTYASSSTPQTITNGSTLQSTTTVSGFSGNMYDLDVQVTINHVAIGDLTVVLCGPVSVNSACFTLFDHSPSGINLGGTVFDNDAPLSVGEGRAPLSGRFRPVDAAYMDYNLSGHSPNGTWTLRISDASGTSSLSGALVSWSLLVSHDYLVASDAAGNFQFVTAPAGSYTMRVVDRAGWRRSAPANGLYNMSMPSGGYIANRDIGLFRGTIYLPLLR